MMRRDSESGFTLVELMMATGCLLTVLSGALWFFAKSQGIYTNERATLDMVQDLRTVFDRFTNELRMAGAGLPGYHGVVSGTSTTLIVRGDFTNIEAIVMSTSPISGGTLPVNTTSGFAVGQSISVLDVDGATAGASAVARITAVDTTAGTIAVDTTDLLPITSGAQFSNFGPGCIINVVERRTYGITISGANLGAITRSTAYENTQTAGATIQASETIASNVLTTDGLPGLSFTYYDAADNALAFDPTTGLVDPTRVAKVQVDLQARTSGRDLANGEYRTLRLIAMIQVRGQYIPAVGF
jgi:type II secretory pathway pseudopilin PulG